MPLDRRRSGQGAGRAVSRGADPGPQCRAPSRRPRPRARAAASFAFKLALAALSFFWLVRSGRLDGGQLAAAFGARGALAYAIAALGAVVVLTALRWWLLLRAVGLGLPLGRTFCLSMIGNFFNSFLPGGVGGDAMRAYYVTREAPPGERLEAATTVFIDRLLGLSGLALLLIFGVIADSGPWGTGLLGRLIAPLRPWLGAIGWAAAGGVTALALVSLPPVRRAKAFQWLWRRLPFRFAGLRMLRTFLRAVRHPPTLGAALFMSLIVHALITSVFFVFARALGDGTATLDFAVIVPLGMLLNTIPGPPQGLGVGEAAFDALFALAAATHASVGTEVCLAWRVIANGWNMVGGLVYVAFRPSAPADRKR